MHFCGGILIRLVLVINTNSMYVFQKLFRSNERDSEIQIWSENIRATNERRSCVCVSLCGCAACVYNEAREIPLEISFYLSLDVRVTEFVFLQFKTF